MKPFQISSSASKLQSSYPKPTTIQSSLRLLTPDERLGFLRLWVSEGIPFAFQEVPMLYEMLRGWLGSQLQIHPKVITVIGSARIGFSLSGTPKYGQPFGQNSDLDLAVVDGRLFGDLSNEFRKWISEFDSGVSAPRGPAEQKYWAENRQRVPRNIAHGFIDPYKIPTRGEYPTAQHVLDVKSRLARKLANTESSPKFRGISARVYRDWGSFLDRMEFNLGITLQSFANSASSPNK